MSFWAERRCIIIKSFNNFNYLINLKGKKKEIIITRYLGDEKNIIIPPFIEKIPVTSIGKDCFAGKEIKTIVGSSIETINSFAFRYTYYLESVDFPNLKALKSEAFAESAISHFKIPKNLTSISPLAFLHSNIVKFECEKNPIYSVKDNCVYLMNNTLTFAPVGMRKINAVDAESIADYAFYQNSIESINMPNVKYIGAHAFENSKIKIEYLPPQVSSIGNFAFSGCQNVKSILIPESVETLGRNAFSDCHHIETVVIGGGLNKIPIQCFMNCWELKNIDLSYVEHISTQAFKGCFKLSDADFTKIRRIDEHALSSTKFVELDMPRCTRAHPRAFMGMPNLRKITLSSNLYETAENTLIAKTGVLCSEYMIFEYAEPDFAIVQYKNNKAKKEQFSFETLMA